MIKHNYVLGFLFDESMEHVVLIEKDHPDWQKGKLNGLGGRLEVTDKSLQFAMTREFQEECGLTITEDKWKMVAVMSGPDWRCSCYKAVHPDWWKAKTTGIETVIILKVQDVSAYPRISNLEWLIAMAKDDNNFGAHITYS